MNLINASIKKKEKMGNLSPKDARSTITHVRSLICIKYSEECVGGNDEVPAGCCGRPETDGQFIVAEAATEDVSP